MSYRLLLGYQIGVAASDTLTGLSLLLAPLFTLRLLHIAVPAPAAIYLSWIGIFVAAVGIGCVYGAKLMLCKGCTHRLETVWILTAITRGMVAVFLVMHVVAGSLAPSWLAVAAFDGACAIFQAIGLRRKWVKDAIF